MKLRFLRDVYDYEKGKVYEVKEAQATAFLTQGYALRASDKFASRHEKQQPVKTDKSKIKGLSGGIE